MKTIFKYQLKETDSQILEFPVGFQVVSVIEQNGNIVLFACINTKETEIKKYEIRIFGTGNIVDVPLQNYRFFGSVKQSIFVWHIFGKHIDS